MTTTKIRIDFEGPNQLPHLMILKEYYDNNRISYAEVIYKEDTCKSEVVIDPRAVIVSEKRIELVE